MEGRSRRLHRARPPATSVGGRTRRCSTHSCGSTGRAFWSERRSRGTLPQVREFEESMSTSTPSRWTARTSGTVRAAWKDGLFEHPGVSVAQRSPALAPCLPASVQHPRRIESPRRVFHTGNERTEPPRPSANRDGDARPPRRARGRASNSWSTPPRLPVGSCREEVACERSEHSLRWRGSRWPSVAEATATLRAPPGPARTAETAAAAAPARTCCRRRSSSPTPAPSAGPATCPAGSDRT